MKKKKGNKKAFKRKKKKRNIHKEFVGRLDSQAGARALPTKNKKRRKSLWVWAKKKRVRGSVKKIVGRDESRLPRLYSNYYGLLKALLERCAGMRLQALHARVKGLGIRVSRLRLDI